MYATEILLDVLEAIDITPEDLPKMPVIKIPNSEVIFGSCGKNALIVLSVGLLGFSVYFFATNKNNGHEKKSKEQEKEPI